MAELLTLVDPENGAKMTVEAQAYRKDILAALDRSIALTPVVPVRDGTYRSFLPLSPYARGLCAGAWGWRRCQGHTGALYWDAGLVTTPLVNPSGLLSIHDRRVQGFLDVLEDRLLLENPKVHQRTAGFEPQKNWFSHAGWQYQCGFERTPELYLQADDIPNFIRSMFNQYAVDIQLGEYTFREHTVGGPPDKIFEESAFLERFRHMLVMEESDMLWLARGTPRAWLEQGKKISVKNAPSHFGTVAYEIVSNLDNGKINATVEIPSRSPPKSVFLRFRHPKAAPIKSVTVNGEDWKDFDNDKEVIQLKGLKDKVTVVANYAGLVPPAQNEILPEQGHKSSDLLSGNDRIEARFTRRDNTLLGQRLGNLATGFNWLSSNTPAGAYLSHKGGKLAGFDGTKDLKFSRQSSKDIKQDGQEQLLEWVRADGLALDWFLRSFPGVSVIECQARVRNGGAAVIPGVTEFGPLSLHLRGDQGRLKVHWVRRDAYKRHEILLKDSFSVSGGSWNAPDASGWIAIENMDKKEILFLGVEWESYWRVTLRREGTEVLLECTLERFTRDLAPGAEMISPRVFLGVSHGDVDDSLRDLHDYLRRHVIPPLLPNFPWINYNIWGTAGDGSDEKAVLAEIPFAADLGIEVFYIDASWYDGSCKDGSGNWFEGLGNWHQEDRAKYPNGLAKISKKVHQAGMKFGLWFAPQMVDSRLVGGRIPEAWVAKRDGKNLVTGGATPITQICLGNPDVVEFLKNSIASAVKRYDLDWVKWDGSGLPGTVCNRTDHGHQEGDGALSAIQGEYAVWDYLYEQFPKLVLEQCGYGSRLDYGLARRMRTNWLDDSSGDSTPVRRRLINGTYVYPSPYLETWVYKGKETDKQKDPDILNTTIRSRMIGLFGFGCLINSPHGVERVSLYPPEAIEAVKRNIADYKKFRHLLREDVYHFLPPADQPRLGDAIQFCKRDGSESVVMIFQDGRAYSNPNPQPFDDRSLSDVVHQANIAGTSGDSQWGFLAQGTANGAGLHAETGWTHGTTLRDMWLGSGSGGASNPHPGTARGPNWIAYAFDKPYPLGKTWVWNWNNEGPNGSMTGLNRVTIEYSVTGGSDPKEWKKLGEYNFPKATGTPDEPGFAGPDFAGALAQYVVMTAHPFTGDMATSGNWGAGDCGLSEIRFYLNTDRTNAAVAAAKAGSGSAPSALERTIVPRGLNADASYTLTSLDTGRSEKATGAQLMKEGVKISFAKPGMSEILLLERD